MFGIGAAVMALGAIVGFTTPSFAKNYIVKELNHGPTGAPDVFQPELLRLAPGDSVTFEATDGSHDARSIANAIPAGAQPFRCGIGKTCTITFTVPGAYAYKCQPHLSFGMVGLIVVGQPVNLGELSFSGLPRRARDKLTALAARARNPDGPSP